MACHPKMTPNRDVSANQIPARQAKNPRERRRRLPRALIFVGFPSTHCQRWVRCLTSCALQNNLLELLPTCLGNMPRLRKLVLSYHIYIFIYLSVYLYLSIYLSIYLYLSIYRSIYIHLSIYLSIYISIYLYVYIYIYTHIYI
jgi:hypothetical protein